MRSTPETSPRELLAQLATAGVRAALTTNADGSHELALEGGEHLALSDLALLDAAERRSAELIEHLVPFVEHGPADFDDGLRVVVWLRGREAIIGVVGPPVQPTFSIAFPRIWGDARDSVRLLALEIGATCNLDPDAVADELRAALDRAVTAERRRTEPAA